MPRTTAKKSTLASLKRTQTTRSIDRAAWRAIAFAATIATIVTDTIDADLAQSMAQAAEVRS